MAELQPAGMAGRTTQGAAWLVGSRLAVRGLDFVLLLTLGRLLGPADFGLVAIAMTLITVVEAIMELPLLQSLISLPEVDRTHLDTAFTLGLLRGLLLALVLGLLAWPFARLYHDPRLMPLVWALCLAPAARGMSSPAMALFARQISFHRDFVLEITGKLAAFAVAIALAVTLRSYWALVANSVLTPLAITATSYAVAPYRPRLSLAQWPTFVSFLGWNSAAQALGAINWQCDRFLIGRNTSRAALGEFSMASDLSGLPAQALLVPLLRPLTAAFALCRDDRARLAAAYLKTSAALLAVVVPVSVALSALAVPAIDLVLGGKWVASAPILRWLALAMIAGCFVTPLGAMAMALGRTQVSLHQALIEFCVKLPLVLAGVLLAGVGGVIAARMVSAVVTTGSAMLLLRRLCGLTLRAQGAHVWRILVSGGAMYATLALLQVWSPVPRGSLERMAMLPTFGATALAVYLGCWIGLWRLGGRPDGIEGPALAGGARLVSMVSRSRLPG